MNESDLCFILEPRPIYSGAAQERDRLSAHELKARVMSKKTDDLELGEICDFDEGLYGRNFRPLDAGRSKSTIDWVYDTIINHAVDGRGFRITRSSSFERPEAITRTHINRSLEAGLMIADLSTNDPVVAYCVALRMQDALKAKPKKHHGIIFLRDYQTASMFDISGPFDEPVRYALVPEDLRYELDTPDPRPEALAENLRKRNHEASSDLRRRVMHFLDRREQEKQESQQSSCTQDTGPHSGTVNQESPTSFSRKQAEGAFGEELLSMMQKLIREDTQSDTIDRLKTRLMRDL